MATNSFTANGLTISVSAASPATEDAAGYAALTFTEIPEVTSATAFGVTYNIVTHQPLAAKTTYKRKGTSDEGTCTLTMAYERADAGQTILLAGLDAITSYSFKFEFDNSGGTNGDTIYFKGLITSYQVDGMTGPDSIVAATCATAIDGKTVYVAAA